MEYIVAAYTDTGTIKETNQDSLCLRCAKVPDVGEMVLAVICDGMGGLKKGELASATVVQEFGNWFDRNLQHFPGICGSDFSVVRRQWTDLLLSLHREIIAYSAQKQVNMGTTVIALLLYGDRYLTVNIGDSRIYERKKELVQLTQDQSLVAREIALGRITEEQSRHHPQRNVLLQCLGVGEQLNPVFTEGKVKSDALYLLCSDGLSHEIAPEELATHLQAVTLTTKNGLTAKLSELTELCKQRGEGDNITSILLRTKESAVEPKKKGFLKLIRKQSLSHQESSTSPALIEAAQIVHTKETIRDS